METCSFIPQRIMNSSHNAMATLKTKMDTVPALIEGPAARTLTERTKEVTYATDLCH